MKKEREGEYANPIGMLVLPEPRAEQTAIYLANFSLIYYKPAAHDAGRDVVL